MDGTGNATTTHRESGSTALRAIRWLKVTLLVGAAACAVAIRPAGVVAPQTRVNGQARPARGPFRVRSYVGRCLTYGSRPITISTGGTSPPSSTRVVIDDCNRQVRAVGLPPKPQDIIVQEVDAQHHVVLLAGGKAVGVGGGFLINQAPLELQDLSYGPAQVFALDGDSIILVADRELVVEVQNGRGAIGTPLVLGTRQLSDSELWSFEATNGSDQRPTSGFIRVPQSSTLENALSIAAPGTVIDVDPSYTLSLDGRPILLIPSGVTIRGNRRGGALTGPQISKTTYDTPGDGGVAPVNGHSLKPMFQVNGDDVRITGLRLRGPSRSTEKNPAVEGVLAFDHFARVIIDHNDMSDWTEAAVMAEGDDPADCKCGPQPDARPHNIRVVRNFVHDNAMGDEGYGVEVSDGAYPLLTGNTFLRNRHAIAGGGGAKDGYGAFFNLVQAEASLYGATHEQDFDMHGSDRTESWSIGHAAHTGGIGGADVEIARNTFLGTDRRNFDLRGVSCGLDRFHDNISLQSKGDAIRWYVAAWDPNSPAAQKSCPLELTFCAYHWGGCGMQLSPDTAPPSWLQIPDDGHRFGVTPNPIETLKVGDFDGDGKDDLFLATGAAWYYAPSGRAEWRLLGGHTEGIGQLLFGDFDGDGRTDVLTKRGRDWLVSWGGMSDYDKINESDGAIADMAIGDFNGDHKPDVFYANGSEWFVSYAGVGPFTHYAYSTYRVSDLKLGKFTNGKTDVLGVVAGSWMVVRGGTDFWARLNAALSNTVSNLIVADFDADGIDDIGIVADFVLQISKSGSAAPSGSPVSLFGAIAGAGRFDDQKGADVLLWNTQDREIYVSSSGTQRPQLFSRQVMR